MPVFVDRTKLAPSYLPKRLLHRDEERKLLSAFLMAGFSRRDESFVSRVQVVGPVGAGKTTLCLKIGQEIEQSFKRSMHVYVNLRRFATSKVGIYRFIARAVAEEVFSPSLSADELLENILTYLKNTDRRMLVTFDDADYHVSLYKGRDTVVYDFTRLHEVSSVRPINVVAVVFVARDSNYLKLLDRPEASSLGVNIVKLEPYTKQQIADILGERVDDAFRKGAVPSQVIDFIAETVAGPPFNGDLRYALDLLVYAGNIAEARGEDFLKIDYVRKAVSALSPAISSAELEELPEKAKMALLAVAKTFIVSDKPMADFSEVEKMHQLVCETHGVSVSGLDKALRQLSSRGYVKLVDGYVKLMNVDARSLAEVLENMLRRR